MASIESINSRSGRYWAVLDNGQEVDLTLSQWLRLRVDLAVDLAYDDAGATRRDPSKWLSDAVHAYHEAATALAVDNLEVFEHEMKLAQAAASIGTLQALLEAAVS